MVNICIVSYFGLRETLQCAADALRDLGHMVTDFPLMKYGRPRFSHINWMELIINQIREERIDYLLWWHIGISQANFERIRNETGVKYLLYNWDDPYNWEQCGMMEKSKFFDAVFISSQASIELYLSHGAGRAYHLLPGFSQKVHHIPYDLSEETYQKYKCDISFCCTNLYDDETRYPDQWIKRKQLVDNLYAAHLAGEFIFHIYGPPALGKIYPKCYQGFVSYENSNLVFACSRINLCTHVVGNKQGYINERVILVGASGGLLLVDQPLGITELFDPEKEIILLDRDDHVAQIKEILANYKAYANRKQALMEKCIEKYSYPIWANVIHQYLTHGV